MSENENQNVKVKKPIFKKWWFWVIVVIVIGIGSGGNKSNTQSTNITSQNTEQTAPVSDGSIDEGMYKIGTDIPAGEYVLIADSGQGYFQVTKDSSGNLNSILSNDMFQNRSIITVSDGQYIQFKMAKAYSISKAPQVDTSSGKLDSGMYKIGSDLKAGEYKVIGEGDSYAEISSNSTHNMSSIVSNDMFTGEKYITVKDGQYLKLQSASVVLNK